jgi:hypothetical protein
MTSSAISNFKIAEHLPNFQPINARTARITSIATAAILTSVALLTCSGAIAASVAIVSASAVTLVYLKTKDQSSAASSNPIAVQNQENQNIAENKNEIVQQQETIVLNAQVEEDESLLKTEEPVALPIINAEKELSFPNVDAQIIQSKIYEEQEKKSVDELPSMVKGMTSQITVEGVKSAFKEKLEKHVQEKASAPTTDKTSLDDPFDCP